LQYPLLNIIGLMTGTSMDGIDISLVRTNGIELKRLNKNFYYKYSTKTKKILDDMLKRDINFNLKNKNFLDEFITNEHYLALKDLDIVEKCDLIGFHGQTIYHNPLNRVSIQLGNPRKLSELLKKDVVFDYRSNDIASGGQGAPLAPIYHKLIIEDLKLELPCCIINIGGVSNLTYWDGNNLIGFDTGPGNALMDDFMSKKFDQNFDKNGIIASKGVPIEMEIRNFLQHEFFKIDPPKSLDKQDFNFQYEQLVKKDYYINDVMATLAEFTIEAIINSLQFLPKKVESILITGGGYRNVHLMNRLKDQLKLRIYSEKQLGINFDYLEAELIAYLSARSIYKHPLTFPSTTGVLEPISGGKLFKHL
jgi:anhydro-N-acetylmuramic acid kinase